MEIRSSVSRIVCFALFLIGCILMTSCVSVDSPSIKMQLNAGRNLNPDDALHSLPVRVKLFQLSDNTAFEEATFQQLWKDDQGSLGSSLLAQKEITLTPGEIQQIKMKRQPAAEYIAVVAIFRHQQGNHWKAIKPLPGQINTVFSKIQIAARGHQVEIR